jgi:putative oxidoreductase
MLERWLEPRSELAYALLRVAAGLMFCFHGVQKLFGVLTASPPAVGSQLWVGGVIELAGGLCIALGVFAVASAFLASGTMAVAYTQFHWKLELGTQLLPAINKGELALLYAVLFLFIACKGAGRYSLDAWRQRRATTPSGASSPRS